ncbi:MAG TPA: hypothetical protein P5077_01245 [bacterium]|nr:hypothetical protein [bacterium]
MKRIVIAFAALFLFSELSAAMFGGEPYEVFDQGGINYTVFGNTLIDDQETLFTETTDRQGDTCLLESSRNLDIGLIPLDAVVHKAYLVWMGAVAPDKMDAPTDNTVHFKFVREDGYIHEKDIVAGDAPKTINDLADPFGFESLRYTTNISTGCSETDAGTPGAADVAYFVYRTDITTFFKTLLDDHFALEQTSFSGEAYYGDYSFSGLDCTDHEHYKCRTLMVSNWSVILLYQSEMFGRKKIFLYPGLARLRGETLTAVLGGLELPDLPVMRFTMVSAEGDNGTARPELPPEMLYLQGQNGLEDYPLVDRCSPNTTDPVEIWDSYSSTTDRSPDGRCMTRVEEISYAYDIDTFYVDAAEDPRVYGLLMEEPASLGLVFSINQDDILTNFLVFSVDIKQSNFDIPGEDEIQNCVCYPEDKEVFCEGAPQYVRIRVENWGEAKAESVYVQAGYSTSVFDYVPDTTEVATEFDDKGDGTNWQRILDGPEGAFPLGEPNLIANTLRSFQTDRGLAMSYLIRFRLLPKTGLAKNCISTISAAISDDQGLYYTNHNVPLKLFPGTCEKTCTVEELKKKCGGLSPDDPGTFDPNGSDDDALTGNDDISPDKEAPDDTVDPRATHPMSAQEPGCSLILF